jgi:hypothetical protein
MWAFFALIILTVVLDLVVFRWGADSRVIEQHLEERRSERLRYAGSAQVTASWLLSQVRRAVAQLSVASTACKSNGSSLENRMCSPVRGCSNPKV